MRHAVSVWGWNLIGLVGLAFEGFLAVLWLAFVGLMTVGFFVSRAVRFATGRHLSEYSA